MTHTASPGVRPKANVALATATALAQAPAFAAILAAPNCEPVVLSYNRNPYLHDQAQLDSDINRGYELDVIKANLPKLCRAPVGSKVRFYSGLFWENWLKVEGQKWQFTHSGLEAERAYGIRQQDGGAT